MRPAKLAGPRSTFDARTWLLPAERTQQGRAHQVPLSDAAIDMLLTAKGLDDGGGYVFPLSSRQPMGARTLRKALDAAGIEGCTVHGFRSTFRDWSLRQLGVSFGAAERALGHEIVSTVTQTYLRDDLLDDRRLLMALWGDFVSRGEAL